MTTVDRSESEDARRSIRESRRRRFARGANAWSAIVLFALVVVLLNVIGSRYYRRWRLGWQDRFALSARTESMLRDTDGRIRVTVYLGHSQPVFRDVQSLLKEYQYAAGRSEGLRMEVEYVDPDRDLARARELARDLDLKEPGVIVFECEERRKFVNAAEIFDEQLQITAEGSLERRRLGFRGEQIFSSAILNVTQSRRPVVCFLTGHGEKDVLDFGKQVGYSSVARALRRDNMEVRPVLLAGESDIPADCGVLVVAGPTRKLSETEVDVIAQYLERSGRLLLLVDPEKDSGMEERMAGWGVRVGKETVVGMTITGTELFVNSYGDHPITRGLSKVATMFYRPRRLSVIPGFEHQSADDADRPRVTVLASSGAEGWAETDPNLSPPRYDADADLRGPQAVAVAVERGPVAGIEVQLKPTRLVVVGDSFFVANGPLESGVGGNLDFFLGAVNWLVERDSLLAVGPRDPGELSLGMSRGRFRIAYLLVVGAVPGCAALLGLAVWLRRRR